MKNFRFPFEELEVWQKAVEFAKAVIEMAEGIKAGQKHFRLIEQVEAAASSVAQNIAEGKGRYSKKEFIQFLYIARGSLYETVTLLTIFQRMGWIDELTLEELKEQADHIGKMISGLISSLRKQQNSRLAV
jgi:four helix bundle protein